MELTWTMAFTIIGIMATVIIVFLIFYEIWNSFEAWFHLQRYMWKIKNRFKKPPQAKCFCICCTDWDPYGSNMGTCNQFHVMTQDCEFCDRATPRDNKSWEDFKSTFEFRASLKREE